MKHSLLLCFVAMSFIFLRSEAWAVDYYDDENSCVPDCKSKKCVQSKDTSDNGRTLGMWYCLDEKEGNQQAPSADSSSDSSSDKATTLSEQQAKCSEEIKVTKKECNFDQSSSGMSVTQMLKQFNASVASNPLLACKDLGEKSAMLNAAVYSYDQICRSHLTDCESACSQSAFRSVAQAECKPPNICNLEYSTNGVFSNAKFNSYYNENLKENASSQCNAVAQKVPAPNDQAFMGSILVQATKTCDNVNSSFGTGSTPVDPNDCSKAANALSPTCMCFKDPSKCVGMKPGLGPMGGSGTDGSAGGAGSSLSTAGPPMGLLNQNPDLKGGNPNPAQAGLAKGDGGRGGGGGVSGGGDLSGGKGKAAAQTAGRDLKTNIYGGTFSGGGFGGSSRGGGYADAKDAVAKGKQSIFDKIGDLKKFLPNALQPRRSLAGVAGPDGITGPETNLFNKVRERYTDLRGTLLP